MTIGLWRKQSGCWEGKCHWGQRRIGVCGSWSSRWMQDNVEITWRGLWPAVDIRLCPFLLGGWAYVQNDSSTSNSSSKRNELELVDSVYPTHTLVVDVDKVGPRVLNECVYTNAFAYRPTEPSHSAEQCQSLSYHGRWWVAISQNYTRGNIQWCLHVAPIHFSKMS